MRNWLIAIAAVALWLAPLGCTVNPATGQKQLNMFADEHAEIALGVKSAPEFLKSYGGPIPSPEIRAYVSDLGRKLAAQSERSELPWEFNVVDSALLNAFALPGGKVFVSRALLAKMSNEAQLAAVLGHEIGHVTAQHYGQQRTRATALQGLGILIGIIGEQSDEEWAKYIGVGTTLGSTLYLLRFSRDHERQSDELGLRYMTRLNYSPQGMLQLMEVFVAESSRDGPERIVWLSTHPLPTQRVERVKQMIKQRYPDYNDPNKYTFNVQRYETEVLARLKQLPPPQHDPKIEPKAEGK